MALAYWIHLGYLQVSSIHGRKVHENLIELGHQIWSNRLRWSPWLGHWWRCRRELRGCRCTKNFVQVGLEMMEFNIHTFRIWIVCVLVCLECMKFKISSCYHETEADLDTPRDLNSSLDPVFHGFCLLYLIACTLQDSWWQPVLPLRASSTLRRWVWAIVGECWCGNAHERSSVGSDVILILAYSSILC